MTAGYQAAELEVTITRRTRRTESATELPHLRSQFATLKKGDPCCLEKDSARRLLRFVICSPLDTPRGLGRGYLFCGQDEARLRRYRDPCRGVGGRLAAARLLPRLLLDGLVAMTAGLSSDAWNLSRRAAFAGSVGLRGFDLYHFADRGRPRHLAAFALQVADVQLDRLADQFESFRLGLAGRDAAGQIGHVGAACFRTLFSLLHV